MLLMVTRSDLDRVLARLVSLKLRPYSLDRGAAVNAPNPHYLIPPAIDGSHGMGDMSDMMETQSDSIDITSIKFAALGAFEASKAPQARDFGPDVSSNDRLRAIQHAFQRSIATATTSSSSQNTGRQALAISLQPAQNVTQQNTVSDLASTVPETQAIVEVSNPIPPTPYAAPTTTNQLSKKMSTQGSLPQDTQPVSQSIYEDILSKAKSVRQSEHGTDHADDGDGVEYGQDSLQEGDEGHIDLLSSYKAHVLDVGDDSDSEPIDFSPTQTQHQLSQFPESQRFKTPGTTGRKRDCHGEPVETPSLPRNPLAGSGAPTPGQMMGLSQIFAATQAVSSPLMNSLPSGPLSDRPSPNIELQTRPATATLSSPLLPRSDLRRTAIEPYSHYKSIKQSQAERDRLSLIGQQERDATSEIVSDDDFDTIPSLVERRRRLKEREAKVQQQLHAVSSPTGPRSRGSVGHLSSPTSRPQMSSPRTSPRPHGRKGASILDDRLISDLPNQAENGLTDLTHDSEEETEQEDEVEIARSSQIVIRTEEDKENLGFTGPKVPETVGRLQSPVNGYHIVDSSPSTRQSAVSHCQKDRPLESNGMEPFAVANSQPSRPSPKPPHPRRVQLTSSGNDAGFVPQSPALPTATHTSSSQEKPNPNHPSTYIYRGEVANENVNPEILLERTSSGYGLLLSTDSRPPNLGVRAGDQVDEDPTAAAQSPRQTSNEAFIAEKKGLAVQDRRFCSRHAPITETTIPETSSLGRRESDLASSAPQLDMSKPASSSSGRVLRSSTEYETAQTHLSTTKEAMLPTLPRQPSYVLASPSGRKRRRMTEIAADPSPRKSGSEFDMDRALQTVVDKEFEDIMGSSSPIPPGRLIKRRRLQERQPNAIVEEKRPTAIADQAAVTTGLVTGHSGDLEDAQSPGDVNAASYGLLRKSPQATRPIGRSAHIRHQLATPVQKLFSRRNDARASRTGESIFDVQGSPQKHEVVRSKMQVGRISQLPSTMPARKARVSIPAAGPASATQVGRPTRRRSRGSVPSHKEVPAPLVLDNSETTNSGSNVPLGDVVAPNQVLACFNGKTRAYYPATCLGITGSDTLRYQIQWEGFEVDETDARGIRTLDLRIGDAVKVNLDGFPRVSHVVHGFKYKVLPSENRNIMTDIRGYSVLLVVPKQRKSLPADLGLDATKEVPVSAIYLDSNMWGQMKGREYEYTPQQAASVLGFATPPERPSTPATPTSRSRRNLAFSTAIAPGDLVGVFAGMAFAISYDESRKSDLTNLIRANGGIVLRDGFHELFMNDIIAPKSNYANLGFTALLADRHSRKEKYMQALSLNLPCLSGKWIESCIAKERIVDWQPYLLPAGESSVLDGATRSRILPATTDPSSAKMDDMIATRTKLLKESAVIFVTGRGKAEEKRKPFVFLTQAIGAGRIEKVADLKAAKTLLDSASSNGEVYAWVFVDDGQVDMAETMLGRQQGVRVVGNEFICQSLILGGLVDGWG